MIFLHMIRNYKINAVCIFLSISLLPSIVFASSVDILYNNDCQSLVGSYLSERKSLAMRDRIGRAALIRSKCPAEAVALDAPARDSTLSLALSDVGNGRLSTLSERETAERYGALSPETDRTHRRWSLGGAFEIATLGLLGVAATQMDASSAQLVLGIIAEGGSPTGEILAQNSLNQAIGVAVTPKNVVPHKTTMSNAPNSMEYSYSRSSVLQSGGSNQNANTSMKSSYREISNQNPPDPRPCLRFEDANGLGYKRVVVNGCGYDVNILYCSKGLSCANGGDSLTTVRPGQSKAIALADNVGQYVWYACPTRWQGKLTSFSSRGECRT